MQEVLLLEVNNSLLNNSNVDIIFEEMVYNHTPFEINQHTRNANLRPDTITLKMLFSIVIPNTETVKKLFSTGSIKIWKLKGLQKEILFSGIVVDFFVKTASITIEVQNDLYKLQQPATKRYSQKCRASFCDAGCTLSLQNYMYYGVIANLQSHSFFSEEGLPQQYWQNGTIKIENDGKDYYFSVRGVNGKEILLFDQLPSDIYVGDSFVIQAACNKKLETCIETYNNAVNFQGEPFIWRDDT